MTALKTLKIDDKFSVEYDPANNDRPVNVLRHGEQHIDCQMWANSQTAMFYAILERPTLAHVAKLEKVLQDLLQVNDGVPMMGHEGTARIEAARMILSGPPAQEPVVIDVEKSAFKLLMDAAKKSSWIPPEYAMGDWISDCAEFLEHGLAVEARHSVSDLGDVNIS